MSCVENFNSGQFHNLEEDYYSSTTNAGAGKYNTFQEFISGSRVDSTLKNFEYENPFTFVPSYGSSVDFEFLNNNLIYGDSYLNNISQKVNNVGINFNLKFDNRSEDEANSIVEYLSERKGFKKFVFQPQPKSDFDSANSYKSLYSLFPYFVQEFICNNISVSHNYNDNVSISAVLGNVNYSIFNVRNILEIASLKNEHKTIIEEYRNKDELDINPSYSVGRDISLKIKRFMERKSTTEVFSDGINQERSVLELSFNSIDDNKLMKLLSFFINKMSLSSFKFEIKKPHAKISNFICTSLSHTYVFKGVHNLSVTIAEDHIESKFKNQI